MRSARWADFCDGKTRKHPPCNYLVIKRSPADPMRSFFRSNVGGGCVFEHFSFSDDLNRCLTFFFPETPEAGSDLIPRSAC